MELITLPNSNYTAPTGSTVTSYRPGIVKMTTILGQTLYGCEDCDGVVYKSFKAINGHRLGRHSNHGPVDLRGRTPKGKGKKAAAQVKRQLGKQINEQAAQIEELTAKVDALVAALGGADE